MSIQDLETKAKAVISAEEAIALLWLKTNKAVMIACAVASVIGFILGKL